MPNQPKIAIVAALEREVCPLIKRWKAVEHEFDGRKFKFFENERAVLVCGGIGAEAARRATEAIINLYAPVLVQSVGFAGALDSTLKVGTVLAPVCVIDAKDGSRVEAAVGRLGAGQRRSAGQRPAESQVGGGVLGARRRYGSGGGGPGSSGTRHHIRRASK